MNRLRDELCLRERLVGSGERFRRHIVPAAASYRRRVLSVVRPEAVQLQELVQVAVLEVLEHHAERLLVSANCQHSRQVRVVQGGQQSHFLEESGPGCATQTR